MWAELRREAENASDLEYTKLQMSVHPGRDVDTSRKLVVIGGRL